MYRSRGITVGAVLTLAALCSPLQHARASGVVFPGEQVWLEPLPEPFFWSWQKPLSDAADSEHFEYMVRIDVDNRRAQLDPSSPSYMDNSDGASVADYLSREVDKDIRNGTERVAILLQGYGYGGVVPSNFDNTPAILFHHDDGLTQHKDSVSLVCGDPVGYSWHGTPWTHHGVQEARAWTNDFVNAYGRNIPGLPQPMRFFLDAERPIEIGACDGPEVFYEVLGDPRSRTQVLPAFGKTFAELWADAGVPAPDPKHWSLIQQNVPWRIWYESVLRSIKNRAFFDSTYEMIQQRWPHIRCSNWFEQHADGVDNPDLPPFTERTVRSVGVGWGTTSRVKSQTFGSAQSPIAYFGLHPDHIPEHIPLTKELLIDKVVSIRRANIETAIRSTPDLDAQPIIPWVELNGRSFSYTLERNGVTGTFSYSTDADDTRHMLAMLRSLGIKEFLLWNGETDQTEQNWRDFALAVKDVWSTDVTDAALLDGSTERDTPIHEPLELAEWDRLHLTGDATRLAVTLSGVPADRRFRLRVEVAPDHVQDAVFSIAIRDHTAQNTWVPLSSGISIVGPRTIVDVELPYAGLADKFVSPDGQVQIMLASSSPRADATISYDLVQLIPISDNPCRADHTRDGQINVSDLLGYLMDWQAGSWQADFDLDGRIITNDVVNYLVAFSTSETACAD